MHNLNPLMPLYHTPFLQSTKWLTLLFMLGGTAAGAAVERLPHCPVPAEHFWPTLQSMPLGTFRLEADALEGQRGQFVQATGAVTLWGEGIRVDAEQLRYHIPDDRIAFTGQLQVFDGDWLIQARNGDYTLGAQQGAFESVAYWVRDWGARGEAQSAERLGPDRLRLATGSFTTCPEQRESWLLSAQRIDLDQARGRGSARHVTLRLGGVPVFFTPYINFPIDDRRLSGLLTPTLGYTTRGGLDIAAPWYWNIAPQYDATLTPRWLARRGLMLESEWRYLQPWGQGVVDVNLLPEDSLTQTDRYALRWRQQATLLPGLGLTVDATQLSDIDYFRDFGSDVFSTSTAVIERRADLVLLRPHWRLTGRVQALETLEPNLLPEDRPYQRLPQILLQAGRSFSSGLFYSLRSEWVQFQRTESLTGSRLDILPEVGYRHDSGGFFIEPRLNWRYTQYQLDADSGRQGDRLPNSRLTRSLPGVSVDTGWILERTLANGLLQTLEPRWFYGYVPFREQDNLPVFDTGQREFGFDSLLTTRRFAGADRVGDTHQLTTALTTRLIDPASGREQFSLAAGQISYFSDRRVQLRADEPILEQNRSDLATEVSWHMAPGWNSRATLIVDTAQERARLASVALHYTDTQQRAMFNIGYRYRDDLLEQTDVSVLWPLRPGWRILGRWNYSLREQRDLEFLGGLEYRSCCYGLQIALRRYLNDPDGSYNNAIYAQLTLEGLTRLDTGLDRLLHEGIAGYATVFTH